MNKSVLIEEMSKKADYSKAELGRMLELTLDTMTKIVKKDGKLQLVGFGTFQVKKRAARIAIKIAAKKVVKFKASKNFL